MSNYEICVSHNGKHFFTTQGLDRERAMDVYGSLKARFSESDGYKISVTEWQTVGKEVCF